MFVHINGEPKQLPDHATIDDAIGLLKLGCEGLAVAVNFTVISRESWPLATLKEGDNLTIIQPVQGG